MNDVILLNLLFWGALLYGLLIDAPRRIKRVREGKEPGAVKDEPLDSWVRF
jgi:hypothetical protein